MGIKIINNEYITAVIKGQDKVISIISNAIESAIEDIKIAEKQERDIKEFKIECKKGNIRCSTCNSILELSGDLEWVKCINCKESWRISFYIHRYPWRD